MIEAALICRREGLELPAAVTGTTAQMFMDNDALARRLAEECVGEECVGLPGGGG